MLKAYNVSNFKNGIPQSKTLLLTFRCIMRMLNHNTILVFKKMSNVVSDWSDITDQGQRNRSLDTQRLEC